LNFWEIAKVVAEDSEYEEQHTLFGLTSFGKFKCSKEISKTSFTNIQYYLPWINSELEKLN